MGFTFSMSNIYTAMLWVQKYGSTCTFGIKILGGQWKNDVINNNLNKKRNDFSSLLSSRETALYFSIRAQRRNDDDDNDDGADRHKICFRFFSPLFLHPPQRECAIEPVTFAIVHLNIYTFCGLVDVWRYIT